MHVVIVGCGRVGIETTRELCKRGHTVAIIDRRAEAFEKLPPGFDAKTVVGTGFDRSVLEEAGIKEAGAFVAVTNGDNSNIVAARIAREHYHVPKVVARIYDPRRAEIYERLAIPTVASVRWSAAQIEFLLFHAREQLKESFAGGELLRYAVTIPDHLVGRPIAGVEARGRISVVGVERGGGGFLPIEGATFQQGDVAHFVVVKEAMDQLDLLLQPAAE